MRLFDTTQINRRLALSALLVFLAWREAPALTTDPPARFTIDPATVRQREKSEDALVATVVLKAAAPSGFICEVRSRDGDKVSFGEIIFAKGQVKGTATGAVHWPRIQRNCVVKVAAFNVNVPDVKLWCSVTLKIKDLDSSVPEE